jgi:DNA (cytosine-5)-methyltransferase 1
MKLGGLFSGVGGFELAWTQLGHEVAWMCEWDPKARKVLEARFPGVPIYPDVRDLDPAEVEAVDVLTGGSPCQGFSVAGTRSGLEHSESQLFADYVRIMDGLAGRGLQYAVWENVPGVLSITNDDGERTFEHVVTALAGGTEPVRLPTDKRWNTGLASGRGRAVAWRVLDSRYFGVAQRRRRVFACVAFGDSCEDRAGRALLAVAEGVRGDSPSSVQAGQGTSRSADAGAGSTRIPELAGAIGAQQRGGQDLDGTTYLPDFPAGFRMTAFGQYEDDDSASTLKQRDHKDATDLVVSHALTSSASKGATEDGTGRGTPITVQAFNWQQGDAEYSLRDDSSALAADSRPAVMIPQAFRKAARAQSSEDAESWVEDGQANTLNAFDVGDTRTTHAIVEPEPWGFSAGNSQHARSMGEEQGIAPPVRAGASGTNQSPTVGPIQYGVRRLTPVECERLQSFPDGWTEPAGSDSARYKAMGNAVTVNVVRWILSRLP